MIGGGRTPYPILPSARQELSDAPWLTPDRVLRALDIARDASARLLLNHRNKLLLVMLRTKGQVKWKTANCVCGAARLSRSETAVQA